MQKKSKMKKILLPLISVFIFIGINAQTPNLVITEIMYNSPESGTDTAEFIEIYNNGASAIDLTNFTCTGGIYTFPNVSLAAGDYYVITIDSSGFYNTYGVNADGVFMSGLSNAGESIVLKNAAGVTIDSVNYDDSGVWPSGAATGQPDGGGASLVLCDVNSDNSLGNNWSTSTTNIGLTVNFFQILASPGTDNGCCSAVTGSETSTICNNESLTVNGTIYNASNPTGTETFVNGASNGCDSVVTINLNVLAPITSNETSTICSYQSVTVNGTVYDASNPTGTETLVNGTSNGCDSIVTINLNVLPALTRTENSTICYNESIVVNGIVYDAFNPIGTETIVNPSLSGCDSIITINLNVLPAIDVSTTQSGINLSANANGLDYQWIDCNNSNALLAGETNQSFTTNTNGDFAVIVYENTCADTSMCLVVNSVAIDDLGALKGVGIYPNPSNGNFSIEFQEVMYENQTVSIYNSIGSLVYSQTLDKKMTNIETKNLSKGIYLLYINSIVAQKAIRLVIE